MGSLTSDELTENGSSLGNIKDVAVIGAGISGVVSTAHLLREGFNVTVFERTGVVGGVWNYAPQPDRDPPFPNVRPPKPNWAEVEKEGLSSDEVALIHGPPNPWYVYNRKLSFLKVHGYGPKDIRERNWKLKRSKLDANILTVMLD